MNKMLLIACFLLSACGAMRDDVNRWGAHIRGRAGSSGSNGSNGSNGTDGTSCVAVQEAGGAEIECANGTSAFVANGAQGSQGATGQTGAAGEQGEQGVQGPAGATGATGAAGQNYTPPVLDAEQQALADVVGQYNQNRLFAGQEEIDPGLACTVAKFGTPAAPQQPNSIAQAIGGGGWTTYNLLTYTYTGSFNQPNAPVTSGLNVFPSQLQSNPAYQTWYLLTCTGYLVVTETNDYEFDVSSDDGSILTVNGTVINNDGLHGIQTASGSLVLNQGVYSIKLQYMQASGNEALIVNQNESLLSGAYLYH